LADCPLCIGTETPRLADLQCNDRVCIKAGAHHSVHLRRHGTDDGVSDASGLENPGAAGRVERARPAVRGFGLKSRT
jgi:hypothetical protein